MPGSGKVISDENLGVDSNIISFFDKISPNKKT